MRSFRRHPKEAAAIAAIATGALMVVLALSHYLSDDSSDSADAPGAAPSGVHSQLGDDPSPDQDNPFIEKSEAPTSAAGATFAGAGINGLQGEGGVSHLPKHTVVVRVTSDQPIGYVGYQIPTSQDNFYGVVENPGKSWSLTTTGYGSPDYAQLFSAAAFRGVVTCTITVDGHVTDRRSTDGPYSQLFCQG